MKTIYFLFISLFLVACSSSKTGSKVEQDSDKAIELEGERSFEECFPTPDANFEQTVTGCAQGFSKVISDQFVLRISPDLDLAYGECIEWKLESGSHPEIELLIFKKGESSLMNICTGIIMAQAPKPIKRLNQSLGMITIGKSDPTDYDGQELPKITIRVDELIFFDSDTYEEMVIRDELFWKVLDKGMPK